MTKTDLVQDPAQVTLQVEKVHQWLAQFAKDHVEETLQEAYAKAPVIPVSINQPDSLQDLRAMLWHHARSLKSPIPARPFKLAVDRIFSQNNSDNQGTSSAILMGHVVQGDFSNEDTSLLHVNRADADEETASDAELDMDDVMDVRVDSMESFREVQQTIAQGMRVALSASWDASAGSAESLRPGALLSSQPLLCVDEVIGSFQLLHASELKHNSWVQCHLGHQRTRGRVLLRGLTERQRLFTGNRNLVWLKLENPMVVRPGDRLVIRQIGPKHTIGSTQVIVPVDPAYRFGGSRWSVEDVHVFQQALIEKDWTPVMEFLVKRSDLTGTTVRTLAVFLNLPETTVLERLETLSEKQVVLEKDAESNFHVVHADAWNKIQQRIVDVYAANVSVALEDLKRRVAPKLEAGLMKRALSKLASEGRISDEWLRAVETLKAMSKAG